MNNNTLSKTDIGKHIIKIITYMCSLHNLVTRKNAKKYNGTNTIIQVQNSGDLWIRDDWYGDAEIDEDNNKELPIIITNNKLRIEFTSNNVSFRLFYSNGKPMFVERVAEWDIAYFTKDLAKITAKHILKEVKDLYTKIAKNYKDPKKKIGDYGFMLFMDLRSGEVKYHTK